MSSKYQDSAFQQKPSGYNKLRGVGQVSNTPKSQGSNTPRSKSQNNPQKIQQELDQLNASGVSPTEFYKVKCQLLTEQMAFVQDESEKIKKQNEHLRTLNFEYVKQLNELSASKLRAAEKIIITPEFFESDSINQKVKDFMRKLANNYKLLEKEQTKLVDHCRIMEQDIENYRIKVVDADQITEKLKQTGQHSIDSLVQSLKDSEDKVESLSQHSKELSLELAIKLEKISNLESHIQDLNNEIVDHKDEYQKLMIKYNKMISQNEDKKNFDHKQIYELQLKCSLLEHELRLLQGTLQNQNVQLNHLDIKIKDLSIENESLSRSGFLGANSFRRNLSGTSPSVSFK
ncbi:hypothetical protein ABPG72_002167 [Tetrahymena utriculariae]